MNTRRVDKTENERRVWQGEMFPRNPDFQVMSSADSKLTERNGTQSYERCGICGWGEAPGHFETPYHNYILWTMQKSPLEFRDFAENIRELGGWSREEAECSRVEDAVAELYEVKLECEFEKIHPVLEGHTWDNESLVNEVRVPGWQHNGDTPPVVQTRPSEFEPGTGSQ